MPLAYLPSPARDAWQFGPFSLRAQALAIAAGIVVAIVIADRRYRRAGGSRGVIADVAAWAVPAGLVPAVIAALTGRAHGELWQAMHTAVTIGGFPSAVALGLLAAWVGCRGMRPPSPGPRVPGGAAGATTAVAASRRIRLGSVLAAVAPAIGFGSAVTRIGDWVAQRGFGRPSGLPWAVAISPVHRPPGYENFATFAPIFLYQAVWDVAAAIAIVIAASRWSLSGDRLFALGVVAYATAGFGLYWLGIAHLPMIMGLHAGELGDAAVLVGAAVYLTRTRRTRTKSNQTAHKSALERDSSVM